MTEYTTSNIPDEIWELLEALCEDRLSPDALTRLDAIVVGNRDARRLYVDYMSLHGTLHWDAATTSDDFPTEPVVDEPVPTAVESVNRRRWIGRGILVLSACVLVGLGALSQRMFAPAVDHENRNSHRATVNVKPSTDTPSTPDRPIKTLKRRPINSHQENLVKGPVQPKNNMRPHAPVAKVGPAVDKRPRPERYVVRPGGSAIEDVIAHINLRMETRWKEEGVLPSAVASDGAWLRRVSLDIIGRIPTADEVERFLADRNPDKRRVAIDRLLDDPRYVRNWTTIWGNLLVGRKPSADVDRPALEKFLRDSFSRNRPWKDIVVDLVSAEGDGSENGAANFLIAHLNNQAVPATAITARLFLGTQVQCTQCHNHPFNNWKQSQFWELNGCFQQTAVVRKKPADKNGKPRVALVNRKIGGAIYFPRRDEVMEAAFPKFQGRQIDITPEINRRAELSRLIFESERKTVARAMVNRMWAHFFGHGFTPRVDDMGPHRPPTHPELLDRLSDEFVQSGYDMKRLVRWICNSRPYQLSSRFNDTNGDDAPSIGMPPAFSRMYVKSMTAEQLYDSLMVATRADRAGAGNWEDVARQRNRWLQQFVIAFDTDENDEATTFDGTVPQALLLMNSKLVQNAVSAKPGTFFHRVLTENRSEAAKVRMLSLAALSREPSARESAAFRRALARPVSKGRNRRVAKAETLQDIFWAFLNSNEFILIH